MLLPQPLLAVRCHTGLHQGTHYTNLCKGCSVGLLASELHATPAVFCKLHVLGATSNVTVRLIAMLKKHRSQLSASCVLVQLALKSAALCLGDFGVLSGTVPALALQKWPAHVCACHCFVCTYQLVLGMHPFPSVGMHPVPSV